MKFWNKVIQVNDLSGLFGGYSCGLCFVDSFYSRYRGSICSNCFKKSYYSTYWSGS